MGDSVDVSGEVLLCEKHVVQVKSLRYLGLQIDSNLSRKHHSDIISAKMPRRVGILGRLTHFLPERTLSTIHFHIVIYPCISYGCVVWSHNFYVNYNHVQILQNKAARIIGKYIKNVKNTSA